MSVRLFRCLWLVVWLGASAAQAQPLAVAAATSLRDALPEVGRLFTAENPGIELNFVFAASGSLLRQIAQDTPADVFASDDLQTMDRGVARRLIDPSTRTEFASNALVLIVPATSAAKLTQLRDLLDIGVRRIAVGSPDNVPAGRYARAALDSQRLWTALRPKLVFASDVRQVLDEVARAEVDAGFVYRSDALREAGAVRVDLVLQLAAPVLYPIARVADSPQPQAADRFIRFVKSPAAQAVLARHGFSAP